MVALKKKELLPEKRSQVIVLKNEGYSIRRISEMLGISKSTIFDTLKRFKNHNSYKSKKRSGRPKKTTPAKDQFIVITSKRDRRKTASDIQKEYNKIFSSSISYSTVQRRLRCAGLNGRVALRKPFLRPTNKKKRLAWAKKHVNWTIEQWKNVLFTDESKFELFGSKRRVYVRRKANEKMLDQCIQPTIKHGGGSVMIWGCFGNNQVGDLVQINTTLNKEGYHQILKKNAIPSGRKLIGSGFVMQQDNDPKHTSKLCKNYLKKKEEENVLFNMVWPPQSPDCNPIELLWEELDREVKKRCYSNSKELFENLLDCWRKISSDKLLKLITRMPRICQALIKARGGYFDEKNI